MASTYFLVLVSLFSVIFLDDRVEADCGGLIKKTNGTITSPSYPNMYSPNQTCIWEIQMPPNYYVGLHFRDFNLEKHDSCDYDSLTIKSKMEDESVREHGKFCAEGPIPNIVSKSNTLLVEFKSDNLEESTGFKMEFFRVSDCKRIIEDTNGVITSPLYPLAYPPNQTCTWEIRIPPNNLIKLVFKHFSLEKHDSCGYDSLTIKSKMKDESVREHGKFCAEGPIPYINSKSNTLLVEFKSDNAQESTGFEMEFFSVPWECGGLIERGEGVITSPFFPSPYLPDVNCTWNIQAPLNQTIKLKFISFNTEPGLCDLDYVTIQSKTIDGEILEHGKFCGEDLPSEIVSESNILLIQFVSNSILEYQGFKIEFSSERCGGLIEGDKGNISTPFFPNLYPPNKMCVWTILVPPQHKLKLRFPYFDIEGEGNDCSSDFLFIQSKRADGEIFDYGKYCGVLEPSPIVSKDSIILTFVSDRSFQRKGFKAEYSIDKWTHYELSTSLIKSTPTTSIVNKSSVNQYENTEKEKVFSANEINISSDEFESTISSATESTTSVPAMNHSINVNQQKEAENSFWKSEIKNLSEALKLLTEKVASIEENQKILFSNCGGMHKINRSLTSKNSTLKEERKTSFNPSDKQLLNDCGKYVFFLRRILDSEP